MSTTQNAKSNLASLFWYRGIRQIQDALIPPSSDSQKGYAGILKGMRFLALAPMMSEALCHLHPPTPHCLGKILKLWIHHSSSIRSCGLLHRFLEANYMWEDSLLAWSKNHAHFVVISPFIDIRTARCVSQTCWTTIHHTYEKYNVCISCPQHNIWSIF